MARRNNDSVWLWSVAAGVLLVAVGLTLLYLRSEPDRGEVQSVATQSQPLPQPVSEPAANRATTATAERALPLPALDQSDADVIGGLAEMLGQRAVAQFLVPERVVRHIVVTIDNAPRQQITLNQRPIKPTPGAFTVVGPEDAPILAPENFGRYAPFIAVVRTIDAKTLVSLYRGLQPLFQQAYEELGHPNAVFDERLLEVIDHLLASPDTPADIKLVQPSVLYLYADARLEKLSAGQKLMVRMGNENAGAVKSKLREIRAELL